MGSGTEQLMRRVLVEFEGLDLKVSSQPIDRQVDMLERGELTEFREERTRRNGG